MLLAYIRALNLRTSTLYATSTTITTTSKATATYYSATATGHKQQQQQHRHYHQHLLTTLESILVCTRNGPRGGARVMSRRYRIVTPSSPKGGKLGES